LSLEVKYEAANVKYCFYKKEYIFLHLSAILYKFCAAIWFMALKFNLLEHS